MIVCCWSELNLTVVFKVVGGVRAPSAAPNRSREMQLVSSTERMRGGWPTRVYTMEEVCWWMWDSKKTLSDAMLYCAYVKVLSL